MVSRPLLVASVAVLVLLAGCSDPLQSSGNPSAETTGTTISVDATAEATAAPDRALVRVAVVATAPDADTARRRVASNASDLRAALRAAGVGPDRVHTTFFSLDAVREERREDERIAGYRAAHGFEIEAPADRAGPVLDAAVAGGANRVDGVTFTLAPETRRRLRQDALALAMDHARQDAATVANASDLSITGVRSAATSDGSFQPFDARVAEGAGESGSTVLDPGPVRVSASVSVTYRAEG